MENIIVTIGYMGFLFGLMYFIIIRPQKKKNKQITDMRANLRKGDTIVTIGGLVGKVTKITDEEFTIETTGSKLELTFKKWALSAIDKQGKESKKEEDPAEVK